MLDGQISQSLTHTCYGRLKVDIIHGKHLPGAPLRIHELKEIYEVGGSPIREALARLVMLGVVTNEGKTGFKVAPISEADMREVYQTFSQIENLALTQAIALGDDQWEAGILATLHPLSKLENDLPNHNNDEQWHLYNNAFHQALIAGCGASALLRIRNQLYLLVERYMRLCRGDVYVAQPSDHVELAECAINRQATKLCGLMKHHVLGELDEALEILKQKI